MQSMLLVMCIAWKRRQRRLGIDDFGNPSEPRSGEVVVVAASEPIVAVGSEDERTPLIRK